MYIGIDCGTQGTKAILWNEGHILNSAYSPHQLMQDDTGRREQSPQWWLEAMMNAINSVFKGFEAERASLKGIGISGQQHGLVLLDKQDKVICDALLWCDTRPEQVLKEFESYHDISFAKKIGIQVPVAFTIAKLLWVKRHNPSAFAQIHKIMLPHDYLNFCLTGRYAIEAGDASGTGWFDTNKKAIDQDILSSLDLPSTYRQPEIAASDAIFGTLRPEMCKALKLNSNVIVSSGGGDNMMAAIGTGNVDEGILTMSLGTSGTVFGHTNKQVDTAQFPDLNAFCSSSNGYLPLVSTMNVTTANNQILNLMGQDISHFDLLLQQSRVGAEGLLSLPFYNGARLPNVPSAKGAMFGMTASNLSQCNMLRATVEGVTYNLARGIDVLRQSGVKFDQACVIGGGANSRAWRQIIADVTGLKLVTPVSTEAAAIGGAIQAYWAKENQMSVNRYQLTDICRDFVKFDESATVTPIQENNDKYKELSKSYNTTVDNYLNIHFAN